MDSGDEKSWKMEFFYRIWGPGGFVECKFLRVKWGQFEYFVCRAISVHKIVSGLIVVKGIYVKVEEFLHTLR